MTDAKREIPYKLSRRGQAVIWTSQGFLAQEPY